MTAAKRALDLRKQRFRRVSLRLECFGGVLAIRPDRLQEGQVSVHHIPCCLVARAGMLILSLLEELIGKSTGLSRA